jgi:putative acetyltransferase
MPTFLIRTFRIGDEAALHAVFHASVHTLARRHYTAEQLAAWAPSEHDSVQWAQRMRANQPFIAQREGDTAVAGFADLQPGGAIDQFFVAPAYAGQGVARALMAHLHEQAAQRGIRELHAEVSLTAEPFFTASGFVVQARQQVQRAGVVLHNARMAKQLLVSDAIQ